MVAFKPALDQLADNLPWTTALGHAYYNDPGDVMNAIQVMRRTGARLSWLHPIARPRRSRSSNSSPGYSGAQVATSGALGFGLGVVVGAALEKDWGWHAWGVDWGGQDPRRSGDQRPRADGAPPVTQRPAVVYNNQTYVSRSETVINNEVRNIYNNAPSPEVQAREARQAQERQVAQQTLAQQTQAQQAAFKQQQAQQANQNLQAQTQLQEAQLEEQQARLRKQQEAPRQEQAKAQELARSQEKVKSREQAQPLQLAKAKEKKAQQDKLHGPKEAARAKEAPASQPRVPDQPAGNGSTPR